jgi:hypothetical protein
LERYFTVRTTLPAVINDAVAAGTVTFQFLAAIRATHIYFLYRVATARTFFLLYPLLSTDQHYNACRYHQYHQQPEYPTMIKIATMPGIAPGTIHRDYLM